MRTAVIAYMFLTLLTPALCTDDRILAGQAWTQVVPEQELLSPKVADDAPNKITSPKTDPIQEVELIEAQDSEIKRTQICSAGMECTYQMHAKTDGMSHTDQDDQVTLNLEKELQHIKYEIGVKPTADIGHDAKKYEVRGLKLIATSAQEDAHKTGSSQENFAKCSVDAIQDKNTGTIRATLVKPNQECPQWASALLVRSVYSLASVSGHVSSKQFSHREVIGPDKRRTAYNLEQHGTTTVMHGKIEHRHDNDLNTANRAEAGATPLQKSTMKTQINGDAIIHHTSEAHVRMNPVKKLSVNQETDKKTDMPDMPASLYGGEKALDQRNGVLKVKFSLKRLSATPAAGSVQDLSSTSVSDYVREAIAEGFEEKDASFVKETTQKTEKNPYMDLSQVQLQSHFGRFVSRAAERSDELARREATLLMQVPAAREILLVHLAHGTDFPSRTSAFLIAGVGRARPMPTDMLLQVAKDSKMADMVREQALWALLDDSCETGHHEATVQSLVELSAAGKHAEPGFHTVALHVQHALIRYATRCSKGAAKMDSYVKPAEEALLQSLKNKHWDNFKMFLHALGNSKLPSHSVVLSKVLQQAGSIPDTDMIHQTLIQTTRIILGEHAVAQTKAALLQKPALIETAGVDEILIETAGVDEASLFKWDWQFYQPPDPKDAKLPKPKFQAGPKFELGISPSDGAYAKSTLFAKIYDALHEYEVLTFQLGVKSSASKGRAKPIVTITLLGNIVLWTNAKDGAKGANEDDATVELNKKEFLGRCQTDIIGLKGAKFMWSADKDFLSTGKKPFMVGPVPCSCIFKLKGLVGFQAGFGPIGAPASGNKLCVAGPAGTQACSPTTKCGDGATWEKGKLLFIMPSFSINVDGSAGIDAGIAALGMGLDIKLIELKLPITIEIGIGGVSGATCLSLQLQAESGAGRMYLYFDSWFTGRKEWDLFEWSGAQWQFPSSPQLLGSCSTEANVPEPQPTQIPDPNDVDCQVVSYPGQNFGGDTAYIYVTSSSSRTGEQKVFPKDVQDNVLSIKTFGNCYITEIIDDDNGHSVGGMDNQYIWDEGDRNLPWDLQDDVYSVNIKALVPHVGTPKPTPDWHRLCQVNIFEHSEFRGFLGQLSTDNVKGQNYNVGVNAVEMSPACNKVRLYDDDHYGDDKDIYGSWGDIDDDLQNDVRRYDLERKSAHAVGSATNPVFRNAKSVYIGCYKDDSSRDFKTNKGTSYTDASQCMRACTNFKFISLQNGGECMCGNAYSTATKYSKTSDSDCNSGFSGGGGPWRNAVYNNFYTKPEKKCKTFTIGSSNSGSKTVTGDADYAACPSKVNKDNWLGGHTYNDWFSVSTQGNKITVKRGDKNERWGMNLKFKCCNVAFEEELTQVVDDKLSTLPVVPKSALKPPPKKDHKPKPSGCWFCVIRDASGTTKDTIAWRGKATNAACTSDDAKVKVKVHVDVGCRANESHEKQIKRTVKDMRDLAEQTCLGCGFFKEGKGKQLECKAKCFKNLGKLSETAKPDIESVCSKGCSAFPAYKAKNPSAHPALTRL